jgi:murein DD-endopeptidase MepM/ murein hydrolase activator NlpD
MQIFSYVDSNIINSSPKGMSLESLLKSQRPSRVRHHSSIENKSNILSFGTAVANPIPNVASYTKNFTQALSNVLSKIKYVFLVISILYVFALFVPYFMSNIQFSIKPLEMDVISETESVLLNKAMYDFVFADKSEHVDDSGNISLSNSSLAFALQPVEFQKYTVKPGDNITRISKKFGLSNISTLIAVNNISNARKLQAGEVIKIPSTDGLVHTVAKNESLTGIASKYGVSVANLLDVNDLSTDVLYVGQNIFIPGARLDSYSLKMAMGELFKCPITAKWRLSSPYGYRADPFTGVRKFHTGMDLAAPTGTPVKASLDGKVIAVSFNQVYGNYVIISHINGYQTLYAHLHTATAKVGQRLNQGDKLGLVGSTGYSTGPHLHFTVYKNGKLVNPQELIK